MNRELSDQTSGGDRMDHSERKENDMPNTTAAVRRAVNDLKRGVSPTAVAVELKCVLRADKRGAVSTWTMWRCPEHPHVMWVDEPDPDEGEAYCFGCDTQAEPEAFEAMVATGYERGTVDPQAIVDRIHEIAGVLDPNEVAGTQRTISRVADVVALEFVGATTHRGAVSRALDEEDEG